MPHISSFRIQNYRVLRDVELKDLQPVNVFIGPNGCGKSTIFDAFQFIADCLQGGVRWALSSRGGIRELISRQSEGPLAFTIKYRESDFGARGPHQKPLITYHLAITEQAGRPIVAREYLRWTRKVGKAGRPFNFLDMEMGTGTVVSGDAPESDESRIPVTMDSPHTLALTVLGQLADNPRVASLRRYIEGWYLSYFLPDQARAVSQAGAAEHLSRRGENLSNVVQYLSESHPERLTAILERLSRRVPGLELVQTAETPDHRLALLFKDGPWDEPFPAAYASDGTIKMLAYLVLLNDPEPAPLLGIEEPENGLHPKLHGILAEEFQAHSRGGYADKPTQVFVSSHSPFFLNPLEPKELWVLERDNTGYAQASRADALPHVKEFYDEDQQLGYLWLENYLAGRGNPRAL
jgi:predicted ATPase